MSKDVLLIVASVAALVAKRVYGAGAFAPLRYSVRGAGRVDAKTTRSGKLRDCWVKPQTLTTGMANKVPRCVCGVIAART